MLPDGFSSLCSPAKGAGGRVAPGPRRPHGRPCGGAAAGCCPACGARRATSHSAPHQHAGLLRHWPPMFWDPRSQADSILTLPNAYAPPSPYRGRRPRQDRELQELAVGLDYAQGAAGALPPGPLARAPPLQRAPALPGVGRLWLREAPSAFSLLPWAMGRMRLRCGFAASCDPLCSPRHCACILFSQLTCQTKIHWPAPPPSLVSLTCRHPSAGA